MPFPGLGMASNPSENSVQRQCKRTKLVTLTHEEKRDGFHSIFIFYSRGFYGSIWPQHASASAMLFDAATFEGISSHLVQIAEKKEKPLKRGAVYSHLTSECESKVPDFNTSWAVEKMQHSAGEKQACFSLQISLPVQSLASQIKKVNKNAHYFWEHSFCESFSELISPVNLILVSSLKKYAIKNSDCMCARARGFIQTGSHYCSMRINTVIQTLTFLSHTLSINWLIQSSKFTEMCFTLITSRALITGHRTDWDNQNVLPQCPDILPFMDNISIACMTLRSAPMCEIHFIYLFFLNRLKSPKSMWYWSW